MSNKFQIPKYQIAIKLKHSGSLALWLSWTPTLLHLDNTVTLNYTVYSGHIAFIFSLRRKIMADKAKTPGNRGQGKKTAEGKQKDPRR